jgi:hypothetical protein
LIATTNRINSRFCQKLMYYLVEVLSITKHDDETLRQPLFCIRKSTYVVKSFEMFLFLWSSRKRIRHSKRIQLLLHHHLLKSFERNNF